jgi:hypothetical protein
MNTLYFDNYGNIEVKGPSGPPEVVFNNGLMNKPAEKLSSSIVSKEEKSKSFILSENTLWMIYCDENNDCHLLYNFIHSPMFNQYYLEDKNKSVEIFGDYCNITKGVDSTCSCTNNENNKDICIKRLLPEEVRIKEQTKNKTNYETVVGNCQYMDSQCRKYKDLNDSFLKTYYTENPFPESLTINLCSVPFVAGKDIDIKKVDIVQKCGVSGEDNSSAPPSTPKETETPSPQPSEPPKETETNKTKLFLLGIIFVILIISLFALV